MALQSSGAGRSWSAECGPARRQPWSPSARTAVPCIVMRRKHVLRPTAIEVIEICPPGLCEMGSCALSGPASSGIHARSSTAMGRTSPIRNAPDARRVRGRINENQAGWGGCGGSLGRRGLASGKCEGDLGRGRSAEREPRAAALRTPPLLATAAPRPVPPGAPGAAARATRNRPRSSHGRLLSCADRATGRDPPPRRAQRLPARAGGQARVRRRPAADLLRPARSRAARAGAARAPRSRPGTGPRRRRGRRVDPAPARAMHGEGRGGLGGPPLVGSRALDRDLSVGRGRARADHRGGRPRAGRPRRLPVADRAPDRQPGAAARPLDRPAWPRRGRRRRPGSATPIGGSRSSRSRAPTARARSPG